ncbi:hypothetical protein CRX72_02100 [Pantoea sp. BRM17]|nr:hypothetical protein CRX72_02100 [Pantoea sp. BRM17]
MERQRAGSLFPPPLSEPVVTRPAAPQPPASAVPAAAAPVAPPASARFSTLFRSRPAEPGQRIDLPQPQPAGPEAFAAPAIPAAPRAPAEEGASLLSSLAATAPVREAAPGSSALFPPPPPKRAPSAFTGTDHEEL